MTWSSPANSASNPCPATTAGSFFESLAAYERYRERFGVDPDFIAADRIRDDSGCVLRYERSFFRPVLDGQLPDGATG